MSIHDSIMQHGGAPVLVASLGTSIEFVYHPPDGLAPVPYELPILGPVSVTPEMESTGNSLVMGKVHVERRTVSVRPKASASEIVVTGLCKIGDVPWPIERIVSATPALITMELRRKLEGEKPRVRR